MWREQPVEKPKDKALHYAAKLRVATVGSVHALRRDHNVFHRLGQEADRLADAPCRSAVHSLARVAPDALSRHSMAETRYDSVHTFNVSDQLVRTERQMAVGTHDDGESRMAALAAAGLRPANDDGRFDAAVEETDEALAAAAARGAEEEALHVDAKLKRAAAERVSRENKARLQRDGLQLQLLAGSLAIRRN